MAYVRPTKPYGQGSAPFLIDHLFRIKWVLGRLFLGTIPPPWRMHKNRKQERNRHQCRKKTEGLAIVSVNLAQISKQGRPERGGKRPRQHHQSKDGADIPRPKIIRCKRGSNAVSAAVAHH